MHELFLRNILDHPADDLPRLIYADWLEEQGDPRGEFIRLQVRLVREPLPDEQRAVLQQRAEQLLATHRHAWEAGFPTPSSGLLSPCYRRGFVERADVSADYFLSRLPDLQRRTPLRVVRIVQAGGTLRQILTAPHLPRLETLSLHLPGPLTEVMACELHRSLRTGVLRTVYLETDSVTRPAWDLLGQLPGLHWGDEQEPGARPALPRILPPAPPLDPIDYDHGPRQACLAHQQNLTLVIALLTLAATTWFGQLLEYWRGAADTVWPDATSCLLALPGLLLLLGQLRAGCR